MGANQPKGSNDAQSAGAADGAEQQTSPRGSGRSTAAANVPDNHPYTDACTKMPKPYYDYENFRIDWGNPDPYLLSRKIGRGKYSEVFISTNRILNLPCVVKMLKPVKEKRLAREVLILQNLCGVPNVISLYDMVMDEETGTPALVFESVNNTDHKELYPTFTDHDVRYYMYELLRTLDLVHRLGIMHRDVKPQNICIDHRRRKLRLIDWGLAEFYIPGQDYSLRVASKHYKGPELLVGDGYYNYAVDIWSAGCVFAAMIFPDLPSHTFFRSSGKEEMISRIAQTTGTEPIQQYMRTLKRVPADVPSDVFKRKDPSRPLSALVSARAPKATPEAIDLLGKMFTVDHRQRITALDALAHPFFDPVRDTLPRPGSFEHSTPPADVAPA